MYISTKTFCHNLGLSCCFRQWRAVSHCRFLHGYALEIRLEFEAAELDENNWVIDFGSLKPFKELLEKKFDHKTLVARDDPEMGLYDIMHGALAQVVVVEATGCEAFAAMVYSMARQWLVDNHHFPRVILRSVEVKEHGANSAICTGGPGL